ncbi:MAG: SDR family NAD(P)-dependent oxidoreductase [Gammaproteobacteria bacterium]
MSRPYAGAVAIVSGGGSGIGAALAAALTARGAKVVVCDIDERRAQAPLGRGEAIEAHRIDVADAAAWPRFIDEVAARHGRLDYLFNNAGVSVTGDARDLELAHWQRVLDVNLHGVVYGTHAAYRVMARQARGHIVNIASLAGLIPFPTNVPYATSKHAVVGLSLSLRAEGEALGVKVSAVCPGFIQSNIFHDTPFVNVAKDAILKGVPFRPIDTDLAAKRILAGVAANRAIISFPFYARVLWRLYRLWPGFVAVLNRRLVADLRRNRIS